MFEVELHSHTLYSKCGIHTALEMLNAAREAGLKGLALTDHGPALNGHMSSPFFERLKQPVPGIKLLKGVECNVTDRNGGTDMRIKYIKFCDVLLVGLHANMPNDMTAEEAADALIACLEKNPWLDIVSHPLNCDFPVDLRKLAKAAKRLGRVLEFNFSKLNLGRVSDEEMREYIGICRDEGCLTAVNTDAHAVGELGMTSRLQGLIDMEKFPRERIVNRTLESAMKWIEERRKYKLDLE